MGAAWVQLCPKVTACVTGALKDLGTSYGHLASWLPPGTLPLALHLKPRFMSMDQPQSSVLGPSGWDILCYFCVKDSMTALFLLLPSMLFPARDWEASWLLSDFPPPLAPILASTSLLSLIHCFLLCKKPVSSSELSPNLPPPSLGLDLHSQPFWILLTGDCVCRGGAV